MNCTILTQFERGDISKRKRGSAFVILRCIALRSSSTNRDRFAKNSERHLAVERPERDRRGTRGQYLMIAVHLERARLQKRHVHRHDGECLGHTNDRWRTGTARCDLAARGIDTKHKRC